MNAQLLNKYVFFADFVIKKKITVAKNSSVQYQLFG